MQEEKRQLCNFVLLFYDTPRNLISMEIASLEDIGRRLADGLTRQGTSADNVAAALRVNRATVYTWLKAKGEGGCSLIAQCGLMAGMTPNQVMLRDPARIEERGKFVHLTAHDLSLCDEIPKLIEEMHSMAPHWPADKRPSEIVLAGLTAIRDQMRAAAAAATGASPAASAPPLGTVIRKDGSVTTYDPPPQAKRSPGEAYAVVESRAAYGHKKNGKNRQRKQ